MNITLYFPQIKAKIRTPLKLTHNIFVANVFINNQSLFFLDLNQNNAFDSGFRSAMHVRLHVDDVVFII